MVALWSIGSFLAVIVLPTVYLYFNRIDIDKLENSLTFLFVVSAILVITWAARSWWMKKYSPRTERSPQPKSYDMNQRLVLTNKMTKNGWWIYALIGGLFGFCGSMIELKLFLNDLSFSWWELGKMVIGGALFAFTMWLFNWRIYAKNTYTIEGNMLYIHEYEIHHTTDLQIPLADIDSVQLFWYVGKQGEVRMVVHGNKIKLNSGFCTQALYTALSQRI